MSLYLNIAAYRFVTLDQLDRRRSEFKQTCSRLGLRGTILLAPEGINMFLAGETDQVEEFLEILDRQPEFADLEVKRSRSDRQPFRRMLVRLKREIIAFGVEGIQPQHRTSPKLTAQELERWVAEGRDFTLLDVRNDYEIDVGTFEGAQAAGIDHFRDFPEAVNHFPEEWKSKPLVMFCTGGIRCEKAGPLMQREGFEQVFQLDGGILKYFEECGGSHYNGDCFVFDHRVALHSSLDETSDSLCFACQAIVTQEERNSPKFVEGQSCPHCFQSPQDRMSVQIAERNAAIASAVNPLPGSEPYCNVRPLKTPARLDRRSALEVLDELIPFLGREHWRKEFELGRIQRNDDPIDCDTELRGGDVIQHLQPNVVEPNVNAAITVLWEDDAIVAVNKPAPLPMHPCGRFNRNTLIPILNGVYAPDVIRVGHRLDSNTSGVVVLSRRRSIASKLQPQFADGTVGKTYLARVQGHPEETEFTCREPISSEPGKAGLRTIDPNGLPARTDFRVLTRSADGAALLEITPKSGRTNQIRVHLWSLGFPIVGDPSYLPGRRLGATQTLDAIDKPMCLHAWKLAFDHPEDGNRMVLEAAPPDWAGELIAAETNTV